MAKRGRPPGSKNKKGNGAAAPAPQPAGPGHNVPSDAQIEVLTREHKKKRKLLLDAEKASKKARLDFDKIIKADLGDKGLADIKLLEQLETPEGEAELKAEMERQAKVARWAGLQIGTQGSLFEEDRRPIDDRAFEEGRRAGMDGKNCEPPHAPGTSAHGKWVEGWHVGQSAIFAIKKTPEPEAEVIKGENHQEPSEPDEFDDAADGPDPVLSAEAAVEAIPAGGEKPWPDDVATETVQ